MGGLWGQIGHFRLPGEHTGRLDSMCLGYVNGIGVVCVGMLFEKEVTSAWVCDPWSVLRPSHVGAAEVCLAERSGVWTARRGGESRNMSYNHLMATCNERWYGIIARVLLSRGEVKWNVCLCDNENGEVCEKENNMNAVEASDLDPALASGTRSIGAKALQCRTGLALTASTPSLV